MTGIEGLLAGRVLAERYHIEKVIGRGGMGAVYRATDQRLGRPVAVKVIMVPSADPETRERLRQRFLREAQTAARLRHPNIVTVHDFGTDPALGLDYLVMELMEGEDVATRVSRAGPLSAAAAVEMMAQAARGLAAGHRAGLVHRDVKPGNLFLEDEHGTVVVRVLDYGIVQVALDETQNQLTVAGRGPLSPAYASPEQLRGDARISPASDVFSLAAVGLYALTGEKPFGGAGEAGGEAGAVSAALARVDAVAGVTGGLRAVLRRALEPLPAARFPDGNAFREALEAVRRGAEADALRLAAADFAPVAAPPVADGAPADDDSTRLRPTDAGEDATQLAGPGLRPSYEDDDATQLAAPEPPRTHRAGMAAAPAVPVLVEDFPREATTGGVPRRGGGRRWVVPAALALLAGGAGVFALQQYGSDPAPGTVAVDSAAVRDSLARVDSLAREDSLRLAAAAADSLRTDSLRQAQQALRDSLAALTRAEQERRRADSLEAVAESTAVAPPGIPAPGDVLSLAQVEVGPQLRNAGQIQRLLQRRYPRDLLRAGIGGEVIVQVIIDEEGRVERDALRVLSSSNPAFDEPAREVAAEMRFAPARLGGRAVRVRADQRIRWIGTREESPE